MAVLGHCRTFPATMPKSVKIVSQRSSHAPLRRPRSSESMRGYPGPSLLPLGKKKRVGLHAPSQFMTGMAPPWPCRRVLPGCQLPGRRGHHGSTFEASRRVDLKGAGPCVSWSRSGAWKATCGHGPRDSPTLVRDRVALGLPPCRKDHVGNPWSATLVELAQIKR